MFCPKCGKKGFPVRIACTACNATLPDVPATMEAPEQRAMPKYVVCEQCGSAASDARIACGHCDATFPRPFTLIDGDGPPTNNPEIAYYTYMSADGACDACKSLDGLCFLPEKLSDYRIPNPACRYPVCWCGIIGVCWGEGTITTSDGQGDEAVYQCAGSAPDVAAFLRGSGGVATAAQIDAYVDEQLAPERERTARENANVELWRRAYTEEKRSPEDSISLYRESIQAWKALLREDSACRWDYFDESYNRLTLTLERLTRYTEALEEIGDLHRFCAEMGRAVSIDTIAKRELRLRKKTRDAK